MKKPSLIMVLMLGMALLLTACSGNMGTEASDSDSIADTGIINLNENPIDNPAENQADIQKENGTEKIDDVQIEPADEAESADNLENQEETGGQTEMKMNVQIGDYSFSATLENNAAVEELLGMMKEGPVTIQMDDYSGFEKVGPLGRSLTTSNSQTTTSAGDIVLYNGSNIVMFYGSNSWSYTRIGKIEDLSDWEKALGSGSITAVFTLAE